MALQDWINGCDFPSDYEIGSDAEASRAGSINAYIKSLGMPQGFGNVMQVINAAPYKGSRLKMSGRVKSEGVRNWAGLWMRIDEPDVNAARFDNMYNRPIQGTTDWTTYQIVLDAPENSASIAFGMLLDGPGQVWLADLRLEAVPTNTPTTA